MNAYLAYGIHVQNFVRLGQVLRRYAEMVRNGTVLHIWVHFFFEFLAFFFFFKCILFSLQNARTNFYKAVLSHCGSMLKLVRNSTILLYGAFFMNVFYLAYETHVQIYVRLC